MRKAHFRGALVLALLAAGCGVQNQVGNQPARTGPAAPAPAQIPGISPEERASLESTEVSALYMLRATEMDDEEVLDEVEDEVATDEVMETTADDEEEATLDKGTVASVAVSSTRNETWFGKGHLTDGKLTSAWGPAASDAAPSLTLALGSCMSVSAIGIKHSGDVKVQVEVMNGGTWTTVATDLTPQQATLDMVELDAATTAESVRLSFTGATASLLVCEVEVFGGACGTTPTPSPSASSSAVPTATPSSVPTTEPSASPSSEPSSEPSGEPSTEPTATPTAAPSSEPTPTPTPAPTQTPGGGGGGEEDCDCHTTGGGWILGPLLDAKNPKISFGFNAKGGADAKGKVNIVDHATKAHFQGDVTSMVCTGNTSTIQGSLKGGAAFTLVVVDNGEPGRADTFAFTSGAVSFSGLLGGGNVQQHGGCD